MHAIIHAKSVEIFKDSIFEKIVQLNNFFKF